MSTADETNGWGGLTLDPASGALNPGLPTFTIYADTSQPVELPPGVEWVGPTPVFGQDYGPGITAAATVAPTLPVPTTPTTPLDPKFPTPNVGEPLGPDFNPPGGGGPGEPLRFPVPPGGWLGPVLVGAGAAIWEGWPNNLGSGEVWDSQHGVLEPIDIRPIRAKRRSKNDPWGVPVFDPAPPLWPIDTEAIKAKRITGPRVPDVPVFTPDYGLYPIDVGAERERATRKFGGVTIPSSMGGVPVFTPIPAPTPPTRGQKIRGRLRKIGAGPLGRTGTQALIGGLFGLGALLKRIPRPRGGSELVPAVTTPLTPVNAPSVASPQPIVLTASGSGGSFGTTTSTDDCNCHKPRGPRRKCLERAPVTWAGGRNKGKRAGTKCVRWESKK